MAWIAAAVIGSSVIGAGAQIFGANKAADTQSKNADRVAQMQQQQYAQTREDLSPYRAIGEDAAYNAGTALTGGANAQAAAANSTGTSIANLSNNLGGYAMYQGLYGKG